ncbi:glycoside hydrolase family 3 protein [Robiginitalea marina]|uniref:beta-glucosidase n=1 Tax=Robiginitalea marina TaxID=2954105 RepID=A0ABT1B0Z9_9FLAO|nr:glycoside hydrolase family 3 N-terminal domain-containing protein [Robiginitalea marina]MCO5725587.1 glycoside hydrolase family 3 protein [Robiginitalea marina]
MSALKTCLPVLTLLIASCTPEKQWTEKAVGDSVRIIDLPEGPTLGYSMGSGVQILERDRLPFKDLNKNGSLDPYEDWRRPAGERARDLASRLSQEEIAGLMLYSRHQAIPADTAGYRAGTYGGKPFHEADTVPYALTDQQRAFLEEDHLRHVLITSVESPEVAVRWNNAMQALVEGMGHGIPANNSSDPRNGARSDAEYNAGSGGAISLWPEEIGLAATFDPEITFRFGAIASQEYRALGITTALSPQVDLATDPRWNRFYGTFGGDPRLATDMARAYVDGFQGSGTALDWGPQSVNAMVKHWPGGGSGEGGRDAHFAYGKFAVYPGGNFQEHLKPFVDGAFRLEGKTGAASAVMPYYTISLGQDTLYGEDVGNGFSKYMVTDLLRNTYGYQGVVCTDWLITGDEGPRPDVFAGKPWGVETLSVAERHYKALEAGADQFGGNNDAGPVLEAFRMLADAYGDEAMRSRIEASAIRLLTNIFQVGLFENPYLDPEASRAIVGQPDFMEAGFQAQLKSIVMLKNGNGVLPIAGGKTAYIPKRTIPAGVNFFGQPTPEREEFPVERSLVEKHYRVTDQPGEADFAIVFIKSPVSNGYSRADREAGGNGYIPISLQLPDYTATTSRERSLGAGDPVTDPEVADRSYRGKTSRSSSYPDLRTLQETRKAMGDKPVILVVTATNPMVFSDIEHGVDAILLDFGVQVGALMEIVSGASEPSGLLPMQMPADMATVEQQLEDVPHDMVPYVDTDGNPYDFAFGLNWKGVIKDERVAKYGRTPTK